MSNNKQYKTGIVLSGGGARGFAHLGAIQALHEADIYPEVISGVSAGAIVGAFYAYGMAPEDILELLKEKGIFDYTKIKYPLTGLLSLDGLKEELKKHIPADNIKDLEKPAFFAATNLNKGKVEYFSEGPISNIVAASACIPILFSPIRIGKDLYIDGGTCDNFPISPIEDLCDQIIGINISPIQEIAEEELDSMLDIAARVFQLSVNSTTNSSMDKCDLLIEPEKLSNYGILDSSIADKLYEIGYEAARKKLKEAD